MAHYKLPPDAIAKIALERKYIPGEVYSLVQRWSVTPTADFIVTRYGPCLIGARTPRKREFLLVKRQQKPWQGQFFVPGGRMIPGETPTVACLRSVKRELGFVPEEQQLRRVGEFSVFNPESQHEGGEAWFSLWHLFEVTLLDSVEGQEISLDKNGSEFAWFDTVDPDFPEPVKIALKSMRFKEKE